ncbi:hypothetical protein [Sporosarcina sp. D27]|uniref:hypothetical protein n=1 Tax=Sporosarcina sp. D27 TaxID=1382305 RepID=UPI0012DCAB38|nr:hypothetical protein [Sporosarcina sp. D27]
MTKHLYPTCTCYEKIHHDDCCHHYDYSCCNHNHYKHECCCSSHHFGCRKDLCNPCFRIRLGGLQDGLSFRLRQMICCEVEFTLENDKNVIGTIVFVGSNFVELFVIDKLPIDCEENNNLDRESKKESKEESTNEGYHDCREHPIGTTLIFSFDKISHMTVISPCPTKNPCN